MEPELEMVENREDSPFTYFKSRSCRVIAAAGVQTSLVIAVLEIHEAVPDGSKISDFTPMLDLRRVEATNEHHLAEIEILRADVLEGERKISELEEAVEEGEHFGGAGADEGFADAPKSVQVYLRSKQRKLAAAAARVGSAQGCEGTEELKKWLSELEAVEKTVRFWAQKILEVKEEDRDEWACPSLELCKRLLKTDMGDVGSTRNS